MELGSSSHTGGQNGCILLPVLEVKQEISVRSYSFAAQHNLSREGKRLPEDPTPLVVYACICPLAVHAVMGAGKLQQGGGQRDFRSGEG